MIHFKPLSRQHFPLLLKWLETPHVKAWWDQDINWTPELIEKKYGSYIKGFKRLVLKDQTIEKPMHAFIMCVGEREIGYIQYYNAYDFPREQGYEVQGLPAALASIDLFIGEPDCVGQGFGPLLMDKFLETYVEPHFQATFVDPDTANIGAIRAYEKAGFKKVKTIKDHTITWMVREKIA